MLTEFGCCCKLAMCSSCLGMFNTKPRLRWRTLQWSDTNSSAESPANCNVKPWSRACWAPAQTWTLTPAQMLNVPSDTLTFKWYRPGSRSFSTTIFPSTVSTENRPRSGASETSLYDRMSWGSWSVACSLPMTRLENVPPAVVMKTSSGDTVGGYRLCSVMLIFTTHIEDSGGWPMSVTCGDDIYVKCEKNIATCEQYTDLWGVALNNLRWCGKIPGPQITIKFTTI